MRYSFGATKISHFDSPPLLLAPEALQRKEKCQPPVRPLCLDSKPYSPKPEHIEVCQNPETNPTVNSKPPPITYMTFETMKITPHTHSQDISDLHPP